jgi:hypothetical protein
MRVLKFIIKMFTHNYCDTCGFTKRDVFITEHFIEAGLIQCNKCFSENKGGDKWVNKQQ